MVLTYTFFKSYISKICNDFSLYINIYTYIHTYIYIYIYIFIYIVYLDFGSSIFAPNNSLATKIKKLNGHMVHN